MPRIPPPDLTRYYRGSCEHADLFVLVRYPHAATNPLTAACPAGCVVPITSREPAIPANGNG